jgi:HEPN domain-containing protein
MTQALDQSIIELLHASRDDEETIQFDVSDRSFGFHAQQAVEKLLKALIGGHGERYAFTHDIEILVNHAMRLGETIPVRIDLILSLR